MARKHTVLKKRMSLRGNKVLKSCMSWRGNMQFSVVPQTTGSLSGVLFTFKFFSCNCSMILLTHDMQVYMDMLHRSTFC